MPVAILRMLEVMNETNKRQKKRAVIVKYEISFKVNNFLEISFTRSFVILSSFNILVEQTQAVSIVYILG